MNWQSVFDSYPATEEIYVVNGMPFLNKRHADAHAIATKKPVETVKRGAKGKKAETTDADAGSQSGAETPMPVAEAKAGKKGKK